VTAGVPQRIHSYGGLPPYIPFHDGLDQNVFIKASQFIDTPFTGQQYADDAVFVDWSAANSTAYWSKWLGSLHA